MKNFTLFLAAALASSAFASVPQKQIVKLDQPVQQMLHNQQQEHKRQQRQLTATPQKAAPRMASGNTTVIYDAPAGNVQTYRRTGFAWQSSMFGLSLAYQDGMAAQICYDNDGKTIWFKDIVTYATTDAYVKGSLSEDGTTITVDMGQLVYYEATEGWGMKLAMGNWDDEANGYVIDEQTATCTFTVEDGTLYLNDTDNEFNEMSVEYPQRILGLFYDDIDPAYDNEWAGYGDFHSVLTPVDFDVVEAPEDLDAKKWLLTYDYDSDGEVRDGRIVKAGFSGGKLYIQGLNDYDPEFWAEGIVEGDKVRIPNGQFLGLTQGMLTFLFNSTPVMKWDDYYEEEYLSFDLLEEDFVFNYDAKAQLLTPAVHNHTLLVNQSTDEAYYSYAYENPAMEPYDEVPGRPQDPSILEFEDGVADYGEGLMMCDIPLFDTNGHFMDPEKVFYKLYIKIDDEVEEYPLYTDEYLMLEEDMLEVPYNFTDGWDIEPAARYFYFYETGFDLMGIQSIYYGGGERHVSNIVWYDGTIEEIEDEVIVGISTLPVAGRAEVYDLMGRRANNLQGLKVIRMGNKAVKAVF